MKLKSLNKIKSILYVENNFSKSNNGDKIMKNKSINNYNLISPENEINEFIEENENTLEILTIIKPHLMNHFPDAAFSLELCDELEWTTERKLLLNVHVEEKTFFNGILNHFNDIYNEIDYLIEGIFCPIVLFPNLSNESYDKMSYNSAINLVARTAYFNNDFDKNMQREMTVREIPKNQMRKEIIEYCKNNPNPDISDISYDLQLDLFDVDSMIDEIEDKGMNLNVKW